MAKKDKVEDWVGYVNDLYTKANKSRWMFMMQWMQCFHFYVGNQWIRYNEQKQSFEAREQVEGKIQYTNNKILSAARMMVGRLLKEQLLQTVIHANNDEQSMDNAKAATRFLDYIWRTTDGDMVKLEASLWSEITGLGMTKYYIDPDKGPKRKVTKNPDGEIKVDVLSPFELVVPPNVRSWDKLPWAMHARMETVEWVYENYDVEVEATGNMSEWGIYQASVQNITTDGAFFGSSQQFSDDSVLVKELWIRPCKKYPNGKLVVLAGDKVVYNEDIPYDKDYWPFNPLEYMKIPFRLWPMGLVEPMIDTQKAINLMSSNILENIRYLGNGVILSPLGAIESDSLVSEPGAVWEYNPSAGAKPEIIAPPPVTNDLLQEKSGLESEIYDIAGIHMMGRGAGMRAAAAAVMLYEQQDETEFLPITENMKAWLKRDAEIKLFLAQKAFKEARKIKVLGEEGQWEIHEFTAADLTGEEEVEIQSKQEFANDKMTRFNQTMQLVQLRDENNQPYLDRQSVLKLLDIEGIDGITTDFDLDYNRAKWENEEMLKGKSVTVNDFDDHAVHIKVANQLRKRIDFEKLPEHVKNLVAVHVQQHQQMLNGQSPNQTAAKGDEQPMAQPMQQALMMQPPMGQPQAMMPSQPAPPMQQMMPAQGLQQGVSAVHNMIGGM